MRGIEAGVQPRNPGLTFPQPETPFVAVAAPHSRHAREVDDDYGGVVAVLNERFRVIRGSCGIQWIVQRRHSARRWDSLAFCATKEGLQLRLKWERIHCDTAALAVIAALPGYFPKTSAVTVTGQTKGHRHAWH